MITLRTVMMKMQGTDDPCDVPAKRLEFFWQQADSDQSGEISFDEFVRFCMRYNDTLHFKKSDSRRPKPLNAQS